MPADTLFDMYSRRHQLLEVEVDSARLLPPIGCEEAIGTRALNGCTCIVIFGKAVILAHISPLPGRAASWEDEDYDKRAKEHRKHHDMYLQLITNLVRRYSYDFPPATTGWGIFAHEPQPGLVEQVQTHLSGIHLQLRMQFYQVFDNPVHVGRPNGTEVVCVVRGEERGLYLNDRKIWPPENQSSPPIAQGVHGGNPASSSQVSARQSSSAAGPSGPRRFWASVNRRLAYVSSDNSPVPVSEIPPYRGRANVFVVELRRWKVWNFDQRRWES